MDYEVRDGHALVASTGDATAALVLARAWLREQAQAASGTHTCVVQIHRDGALVGEHVVALLRGPLAGE